MEKLKFLFKPITVYLDYTETTDLVLVCRQMSSLVSWVENSRPLSSNFQLNQLTW